MSYVCVKKRSIKPAMRGSKVESIKEARKDIKNSYRKGGEKLIDSIVFLNW